MGLLVLLTTAAFIFIPSDSFVGEKFHSTVDQHIQIEKQENGLTKFSAFGESIELDVKAEYDFNE